MRHWHSLQSIAVGEILKAVNYLILSLFLGFSSFAYSANNQCVALFENVDLAVAKGFAYDTKTQKRIETEVQSARKVSKYFMSRLRAQSDKIKAQFKDKVLELDWLCMGAGPQCAAASLVLGKTNYKSMVIEKTNTVASVFANKDFFINTSETNNLTMHGFPDGVGSLANFTSQKFAHSNQLATYIQNQQYGSNVPVLLGTTVIDVKIIVKEVNGKREEYTQIKTSEGITIIAKNLVIATGLGKVSTRVSDPEYVKAFEASLKDHSERPSELQEIMSTDTFLEAIKAASTEDKKIKMPKRIIIFGNGDGSRISVEGLRAKNIELPENFEIIWVGNPAETAEQYVESRKGGPRYIPLIVPFYQQGRVKPVSGHAKSWTRNKDGSMQVTVVDGENLKSIQGDIILDGTGYEPIVPGMLNNISPGAKLVDIKGPIEELNLTETALMRQVQMPDGHTPSIYAAGPAAGTLPSAQDLAHSPSSGAVSIFNNATRTSYAMSQILGLPKTQNIVWRKRPSLLPFDQIIVNAEQKRKDQQQRANTP